MPPSSLEMLQGDPKTAPLTPEQKTEIDALATDLAQPRGRGEKAKAIADALMDDTIPEVEIKQALITLGQRDPKAAKDISRRIVEAMGVDPNQPPDKVEADIRDVWGAGPREMGPREGAAGTGALEAGTGQNQDGFILAAHDGKPKIGVEFLDLPKGDGGLGNGEETPPETTGGVGGDDATGFETVLGALSEQDRQALTDFLATQGAAAALPAGLTALEVARRILAMGDIPDDLKGTLSVLTQAKLATGEWRLPGQPATDQPAPNEPAPDEPGSATVKLPRPDQPDPEGSLGGAFAEGASGDGDGNVTLGEGVPDALAEILEGIDGEATDQQAEAFWDKIVETAPEIGFFIPTPNGRSRPAPATSSPGATPSSPPRRPSRRSRTTTSAASC